jgi:hypothetical protein
MLHAGTESARYASTFVEAELNLLGFGPNIVKTGGRPSGGIKQLLRVTVGWSSSLGMDSEICGRYEFNVDSGSQLKEAGD